MRHERACSRHEGVLGLDLVAGQGRVLVENGLVHGDLPVCWLRGSAPMDGGAVAAAGGAGGAAGEGEGDGELHLVRPARGAGAEIASFAAACTRRALVLPLPLEVLRCNFCCRASLRLRFAVVGRC